MFSINDFKASINTRGILRSNKYIVEFLRPQYLLDNYGIDDQKLMSLRCEAVSIPGFNFLSADGPPRFGYGPVEKNPYVPGFDGMSLTFIQDSRSRIYQFFYDWTMKIVGFNGIGGTNMRNPSQSNSRENGRKPYEVGYKSLYQTDLIIRVYDGNKGNETSSEAGNEIIRMTAYGAFPMGLPSVPLGWETTDAMKLSIPFTFTDFQIQYFAPPIPVAKIQSKIEKSNNISVNTARLPPAISGRSDIRSA